MIQPNPSPLGPTWLFRTPPAPKKRPPAKRQAKRPRGSPREEPARIIEGDCIVALSEMPPQSARLVVADPPYNIGVDYGAGAEADRRPPAEYLAWCEEWLTGCRRVLTADGSLWLIINDEWAAHFLLACERLGFTRRNWLKWYETFGVNCSRKFNRCSRHILYFVRDPRSLVFHPEAVRRPSDRQTKYNDHRANPAGKILDDVWQVPRVAGTHRERIPGFPTQIPLIITRRIVGCASDPGDLVVDPFSGSASTGVAALELGRRYIGVELSSEYAELSRNRLELARQRLAE